MTITGGGLPLLSIYRRNGEKLDKSRMEKKGIEWKIVGKNETDRNRMEETGTGCNRMEDYEKKWRRADDLETERNRMAQKETEWENNAIE